MSTTQATIIVPSNPADQKTILDAVKEADACLVRVAGEKEQIKAIVEDLHTKFPDIGKKHINRMIRTYHKQNFNVVEAESEDFSALYTTIVK